MSDPKTMRFAFSTMPWGARFWDRRHLRQALESIAAAGFTGVEIYQGPDELGGVKDLGELLKLLEKCGLELTGMIGGSIDRRIEFYRGVADPPGYWGDQDWDETYLSNWELPCPLALHAHAHRSQQLHAGAMHQLARFPAVLYLPDTAHLWMEGLPPADAIKEAATLQSEAGVLERFSVYSGTRVAAVHLKDWIPGFGRTSPRYARGFRAPGAGEIALPAVMRQLRDLNYTGWVVIEVNRPVVDVETTLKESVSFLASEGFEIKPRKTLPEDNSEMTAVPPIEPQGGWTLYFVLNPQTESRWRKALFRAATEEPHTCFQQVVQAAVEILGCRMASWWTCSLTRNDKSLLAIHPEVPVNRAPEPFDGSLVEDAVLERRAKEYDLRDPKVLHKFQDTELVAHFDLQRLIVIPVLNTHNPNHVRSVLMLYPGAESPVLEEPQWFQLGQEVAIAGEASVEALCSRLETKVHARAGRCSGSAAFLAEIRRLVQTTLECDGTAAYLVDDLGTRLTREQGEGICWQDESHFWCAHGAGILGRVWADHRPNIAAEPVTEAALIGKQEGGRSGLIGYTLAAPILDHVGDPVGVLLCANRAQRLNGDRGRPFSDEDSALVEVICMAAVNHLLYLRGGERRKLAEDELRHVFLSKIPLIRQELRTIGKLQRESRWSWEHRYPQDIMAWCDRLGLLVDEAASNQGPRRQDSDWVRLVRDVVAPIVRALQPELEERRFPSRGIKYTELENLPSLSADYLALHGIVFNILENAIKYAQHRPSAFSVRLWWERAPDGLSIHFDDRGIGIPQDSWEQVFEKRFRLPEAKQTDPEGQGLGMFRVRQDAARFGGEVRVTRASGPTRITLFIPQDRVAEVS